MIHSHEIWAPIEDFTAYEISSYGRVGNIDTDRLVRPTTSSRGTLKVGLYRDGVQHTRVVARLVLEAYLPMPPVLFDTPVYIDGDRSNPACWNLVYRPRWFALKYAQQFRDIEYFMRIGPVICMDDDISFTSVVECGMHYAVLFEDIVDSIVTGGLVFPVDRSFEMGRGLSNNPRNKHGH